MPKTKNFKLRGEDIKQLIPPTGACHATDYITVDGLHVHYMDREEPSHKVDSGWRFYSGRETQEYADDPENWAIYDVNTIANYDPAIILYLQMPVGTRLERILGTSKFKVSEDA